MCLRNYCALCVCMCMCMCLRIRARKHAVQCYPHASRAPPRASPAPLPGLTPQSVPLDLKSKPTKQGLLVPLKRRTEKVAIVQSLLEPTVITTLAAEV